MAVGEQATGQTQPIWTPDQRVRVFVSSTLGELSAERAAVRRSIERLRLAAVMFETAARPHPPRDLYRAYLEQSHVFIGVYWERYGWVAPDAEISGIEDEYRLADGLPRLIYIKEPAPRREPRLQELLDHIKAEEQSSYKRFADAEELAELVSDDLAILLGERFASTALPSTPPSAPAASRAPAPLTETIGRQAEIAAVADLVEQRRLVTLTGPGGVGKTRLAVEVAHKVDRVFPGGAHFVPLAAVTQPDLVLHTVADRLGIAVEGTCGPEEALAARLSGRGTLLVLDNLEQVAAAGPDLAGLLERCPELHILATSRQALRVRGERDRPVAPLPLPAPGLPVDDLRDHPAVRLFADRARDVDPGFQLDAPNATAVAELCRRLDGLPLAIELAAARTRLLPPAALVERLDRRFDALGTGGVDRPQRQRTLRSTIEWSHDLLDRREQQLFARLSVFAGGFTLSAAEAVCGIETDSDVIETLASLRDKSLIVPADVFEGEPRYHMLETVRAYAEEQLRLGSETPLLRRRHLDWYCELANRAQPHLCGPGQREWAARFDPERTNLRTAAQAALDFDDDETIIELIWDVVVFYFIRDAVHEPESWMTRVAAAGRPLSPVLGAKRDSLLTLMRIHRGEYSGARESLQSALEVFRSRGMSFESAVTLKELAWVRYLLDADTESAVAALQESGRLFSSIGHDWGVALTEIQLGSVLTAIGELPRAESSFQHALEVSRRIDNEPLMARALQQLAMIRVLDGRPDDATPLIEQAVALSRQGRHLTETSACLDTLGAIAFAHGQEESAVWAIAGANATRYRLGVGLWPSTRTFVDQLVERVRGDLGPDQYAAVSARAHQLDVFELADRTLRAVRTVG